ncbi:MAG: ribose 5-phosphate isomerase B [Oscillospiraceae bacterium]|jgi:ribose 5-phosphate isomerase B|nr:ribose 5-phosphate isomerase B [Oscillospiraceae bacterium]
MIALGSDHAGYALKLEVAEFLRLQNIEFIDYGTDSAESVDYPIYGKLVGEAVVSGKCELGVVICGSGIGVSIAANKIPGVRAANCTTGYMAEMSRRHNDANVLALGARITGSGEALEIVGRFLGTGFEEGRHARRVAMIEQLS